MTEPETEFTDVEARLVSCDLATPSATSVKALEALFAQAEAEAAGKPVLSEVGPPSSPDGEAPPVTLLCTYCHDTLGSEGLYCATCLAPHHEDCLAAHGRCAVPGCASAGVVRRQGIPRRRPRYLAPLAALVATGLVAAAALWPEGADQAAPLASTAPSGSSLPAAQPPVPEVDPAFGPQRALPERLDLRVLIYDGEPSEDSWLSETAFLTQVLGLRETRQGGVTFLHPQVETLVSEVVYSLMNYDVLILANVGRVDAELADAVEAFVREGGSVVVTAGDQVDPGAYNEFLWRDGEGPLPARLQAAQGGLWRQEQPVHGFDEWVASSSIMTVLKIERHASAAVRAWGRGVSVCKEDPSRVEGLDCTTCHTTGVLEDWRAGIERVPLLVERRFGKGRCLLWTTTVDVEWTNMSVYDTEYVPLWRELVLELGKASWQQRQPR